MYGCPQTDQMDRSEMVKKYGSLICDCASEPVTAKTENFCAPEQELCQIAYYLGKGKLMQEQE